MAEKSLPLSFRVPQRLIDELDSKKGKRQTRTTLIEDAITRYVQDKDALFAHKKVIELREKAYGPPPQGDQHIAKNAVDLVSQWLVPHLENDLLENIPQRGRESIRQACFDAFMSLCRDPVSHARSDNQKGYEIVMFSYPTMGAPDALQAFVARTLHAHSDSSIQRTGENSFFDVAAKPELAYRPRVFAFSFYLSRERHQNYGILPYGWHRKFGVVLNKNLMEKVASELHMPTDPKTLDSFLSGSRGNSKVFMNRLIEEMLNHPTTIDMPPKIYSVDGFIHEEITAELLYERGGVTGQDAFERICRKFIPENPDMILSEGAAKLKNAANRIFLYDKIYANQDLEDADLVKLTVAHGLEIPVGIGLTLTTLRKLLIDNGKDLRTVYDALRSFFLPNENPVYTPDKGKGTLEEQFDSIGIELDLEMLSNDSPKTN